jgi:transposase
MNTWRAGYGANSYVRFGGRSEETGGSKDPYRASLRPYYNILEQRSDLELLVVNAQHLKTVPGRKTDVKDAEWIATLLRHGLVRASLIPDRHQRELRELTRYRTALVRQRANELNRLQKTLEGANIKLAAVLTDVTGVSGQRILQALIEGESEPQQLSELAHGRVLRHKREALERAVAGRLSEVLRFVVQQQLQHLHEPGGADRRLRYQDRGAAAPF